MPLVAFLRVCARRWYVVLLGLALTLGTVYVVHGGSGVYYSQVQLVLVAPPQNYYPNTIAAHPFALTPTASVLVADWNGTHPALLTASSETTLYGEGVRRGTQVRLPNQGSQFQPLFFAPFIDVQVVGPSETEVTAEATRVVEQLRLMLQRRQDFAGVPPRLRITTLLSPEDVTASYVAGSGIRAAAATFVLGLVGTSLLTVGVDRVVARARVRRRRRRHAPALQPGWPSAR